jgi:hypothetical protein
VADANSVDAGVCRLIGNAPVSRFTQNALVSRFSNDSLVNTDASVLHTNDYASTHGIFFIQGVADANSVDAGVCQMIRNALVSRFTHNALVSQLSNICGGISRAHTSACSVLHTKQPSLTGD